MMSFEDTIRAIVADELVQQEKRLLEKLKELASGPHGDEMLRPKEAALVGKCTAQHVRNLVSRGLLKAYGESPRRLLVSRKELLALMEQRPRNVTDEELEAQAVAILAKRRK